MVQRASILLIFVLLETAIEVALARSLNNDLIKYAYNSNGLGTYSFEFENFDGSFRREDGGLVTGPNGESLVVRGEYGYVDPDGLRHVVHYVADENGFQPQPEESDTRLNDRRIV